MLSDHQKQDISLLLEGLSSLQPQEIFVEERSNTEVLLSFKLDNGVKGLATEVFFGTWNEYEKEYGWILYLEGMSEN